MAASLVVSSNSPGGAGGGRSSDWESSAGWPYSSPGSVSDSSAEAECRGEKKYSVSASARVWDPGSGRSAGRGATHSAPVVVPSETPSRFSRRE